MRIELDDCRTVTSRALESLRIATRVEYTHYKKSGVQYTVYNIWGTEYKSLRLTVLSYIDIVNDMISMGMLSDEVLDRLLRAKMANHKSKFFRVAK